MWRWLKFRGREQSDEEVGREIRAHLELEAEERVDAGSSTRRSRIRGAARFRQRVAGAGVDGRRVALDGPRAYCRRTSVSRCAAMRKSPALHGGRAAHPGAGHRREHGDLQRRERRAAEAAAVSRPGDAGDPSRPRQSPISLANFVDWRRESRSYEAMAAAELWSATLTGGEHAEQVSGLHVEPGHVRDCSAFRRPSGALHPRTSFVPVTRMSSS